jgi:phosphoribosylformimino-5-aminoimidazole carboxamide ribotide isomerase
MSRFEVLPAIDLQGGGLARMRRGDAATLQSLPGDPLAVAASFAAEGARWIHVVDLDAAVSGTPANLDVLETITTLPVRVQAGGGLSAEGVAEALERGADRAVLGSAAVSAWDDVPDLMRAFGSRLVLGLDLRGGRIESRGRVAPGRAVDDVLADVAALPQGPTSVVVTFVERDGELAGPDVDGLVRVARRAGVPVIASGGVRSIDDLRALAALGSGTIAGAIVGRALRERAFSLSRALAVAG